MIFGNAQDGSHMCLGLIYLDFLIKEPCLPNEGTATVLHENVLLSHTASYPRVMAKNHHSDRAGPQWKVEKWARGKNTLSTILCYLDSSIPKSLSKIEHLNSFIKFLKTKTALYEHIINLIECHIDKLLYI